MSIYDQLDSFARDLVHLQGVRLPVASGGVVESSKNSFAMSCPSLCSTCACLETTLSA